MPAPYRRACDHCVQSKRRCDMALPQCYRCHVRSLECHYETLPSSRRTSPEDPRPCHQEILTTPADYNEGSSYASLSHIASGHEVASAGEPLMDHLLPPFPDYDLDWQDAMANIESFSVPDQLILNDAPSRSVLAGAIYQQRIVYAVQRLRSFPALFVLNGRTTFIHKSLYDTYAPQALGDILGLCALYGRKTDRNQSLVNRIIIQNANRFVEGLDLLASSGLDLLASVQALVLLQIIRLFDGDIRQRADAERTQTIFVDSIRRLQQRMQNVGDPGQNTLCQSRGSDSWDNWLYAESLRRTVIVGYTLEGLYCFLKNGWDDSHHEFEHLSFFGQKELWLASSRFEWESALDKHPPLPIRFSTWDADMAMAKPGDIEDLGMIMMALMKGVDHCCHWVGEEFLSQFGLQQ